MSQASDNEAFVREFQRRAGVGVDGWAGKDSRAALDRVLPPPQAKTHALRDEAAFFAAVRAAFGPLSQAQVDGIQHKLKAMASWPIFKVAYGLATSYHETDAKLQPIAEYGKGKGRPYGVPGRHNGQIAYGRGDVQLTWDYNYEAVDKALGLGGSLTANYDRALEPDLSARIMVYGMDSGLFTTRSFSSYRDGDYVNYRRIINGTDKAEKIAGYARNFEAALKAGGWS